MKISRQILLLTRSIVTRLTRPTTNRRRFISALGAVALLLPSIGHAQETWTFDPTFQRTPLRVTSEAASGVKVLSSGNVLIHSINGGLMSGANGQRIGPLVRVDPNTGAIDPTWSPDPTLTGSAFLGVAEAADGKIYYSCALIGDLANPTDPAVNRLVRLNTDGSRDTSFNSPIFARVARFLGVQTDGKIIVCSGQINLIGVPPPGSIVQTVRLNTDGTLDTTFQSPNFQRNATDPPALDVGVFGNPVIDSTTGKIYFCGLFRFVNGQPRQAIVRCNADGTVDASFVPTGLIDGTFGSLGRAMVLQTGGKVVLGGRRLRTPAGGATCYALLRFNTDGTLDPAFALVPTTDSNGIALVPGYLGPRDIHTLPSGNILTSDTRVLRFLPDGTLDSTFAPLDYSSPFFTPNNGQIAGFHFDVDPNTGAAYLENPGPLYARLGGVPVPGEITKLTPGGTIDTQFNSPVFESEDFAPDVQIAASGAVYVSGHHTDFGNAANATIARLLPDGTRDATYSLDALPFADKQAAGFALLPDSSAYVIYSSGSFNGGYSFSNLVHLLPTGAIDTSFHLSSALQTSLSINAFDGNDTTKGSLSLQISPAPSGRAYLFSTGDPQATVNANGNLKPTRINADGTEDTSVPALGFPVGEVTRDSSGITGGSTGYLNRLAQTADGGFIILASVAPFPTSTGAPYNYKIIKLHADGSLDPTFGSPSLTSTLPSYQSFPVLFDPVTQITRQPPNGFWSASAFPVSSATTLPDGSVVLAGNFRLTGGSTDYPLAKLTPAGAFDTSFSPPVLANSARPTRPTVVTNVRVAPDGKVWVLGRFDTIGGNPAPGVARLNPGGTLDSTFGLTGVGYYDSFGDAADVVFANSNTAYLVGTFRRPGEPIPFAVTRIGGPPVITSPPTATATENQLFVYQVTATGSPTSYTATPLPAGLTFDSAHGILGGTPTDAGTPQIQLSASNSFGTGMATLTLTVQSAPSSGPIIRSGTSITARTGQAFSFDVFTIGGSATARLSATGLPPGLSADPVTGVISGIPTADGSFGVTLTVTDGAVTTTSTLQLTFTSDPAIPVIISPRETTLAAGQFFTYTIVAPSSDHSGTTFSLIGTLPPGLSFDPVTGTISGTYNPHFLNEPPLFGIQLFATNSSGTTTAPLYFLPPVPGAAKNISTRLAVGTSDNVLIGGIIIQGNAPKKVIIRAIGPELTQYGVPGALQDPTLELHDGSGALIGQNDNWGTTIPGGVITSDQVAEIQASGLAPGDSHESAIISTLQPGNYTAIVSGVNNTTGNALVEVYDLDTTHLDVSINAQLGNISTRGLVQTGDNVMIGGFIVRGELPATVIVRAIGPSLTAFGVPGALQDPTLELHDVTGAVIGGNDNWQDDPGAAQIQANNLAPSDPRESATIVPLNPGNYTAIVRGANGTTGVALVEAYVLQ